MLVVVTKIRQEFDKTKTHYRPGLIDWCLSARQHVQVNLCQLQGGKSAKSAKDDQRCAMPG